MIDISDLTPADKGRWVRYAHYFGTPSAGILKGWNSHILFIVYHCERKWELYANYMAEGTDPDAASFVFPSKPTRSVTPIRRKKRPKKQQQT